jgi:hypothetical protein
MFKVARNAIRETAREIGLGGKVKIGVVTGDDILGRLEEFEANGVEIVNMETGEPLSEIAIVSRRQMFISVPQDWSRRSTKALRLLSGDV